MTKVKEFYPCGYKDCRFYGIWNKSSDDKEATIVLPSTGKKKPKKTGFVEVANFQAFVWCIACENFQKINNFIDRG